MQGDDSEVEISGEQYRAEKARTDRKLAGLRRSEVSPLEEAAAAEERGKMLRLFFQAVYCDPSARGPVSLEP
jgi:hypothetical protein